MSELTRGLRRELAGDGFPQENPLVALGIAAEILDLGLTEDELYDYLTKDVARRLVMRFHPDRVDPHKRADVVFLQRKHAQAYEELQNRERFRQALAEFRNLKAEERSETRLLRQALLEARDRLESFRKKELFLTTGIRQLERDRLGFERIKAEQDRVVPMLRSVMDSLKEELAIYQRAAMNHRRRFAGLSRYVSHLSDVNPGSPVHAFEARWVIVAGPVLGQARGIPLPITSSGRWKSDFLSTVNHLKISPATLHNIKREWVRTVKTFDSAQETRGGKDVSLRLHVLMLEYGRPKVIYGWEKADLGGRVIGSIPPPNVRLDPMELAYLVSRDNVLESLVPFLSVGNLMISEKIKRIVTEEKTKKNLPLVKRETRHLILAAG